MQKGPALERSEPSFRCEVPACARSLAGLRASFTRWLTALGVADLALHDLVLTMSELAAASLGEAPACAGWLRVDAWCDEGVIAIEVSDDRGAVHGPARGSDPGEGGAALAVVATLAEVFAVRERAGARVMRARVRWEDRASQPVCG